MMGEMSDPDSIAESEQRGTLEAELRQLVTRVTKAERATGTNRECTYGVVGAERVLTLRLPPGYDAEIQLLRERYRELFVVEYTDWVMLVAADGTQAEAHEALHLALRARGLNPLRVDPGDVRILMGGYRGSARTSSPYFQVLVRQRVLNPSETPDM
jgi:hypothetical protein